MKYAKEALLLCALLALSAPSASAANNILPEKFSRAITADLQHRPQDIVIRKIAVPAAPAPTGENSSAQPADSSAQGTAATELKKNISLTGSVFGSYGDDENALRITDASVVLDKAEIVKAAGSSSSLESGDSRGVNAALLAADGAKVTLSDSSAESSAPSGNALFSCEEGSVITASRTEIRTSGPHSAGLMTSDGGIIRAEEMNVITQGDFSAPIRAGQGGGVITVRNGTFVSGGLHAPAIHSAGDIAVYGASLAAARSAGILLAENGKIALENCTLEGNMAAEQKDGDTDAREDPAASVLFLSSGDGRTPAGPAEFSAKNGSIISHRGAVFAVNRTEGLLTLDNVKLRNEDPEAVLLRIAGTSDKPGKAKAVLLRQKAEGKILTDSVSSLDLTLDSGTVLKGSISDEDSTLSGSGTVLYIGKGARWELTGDSVIRRLDNRGKIETNGFKLTVRE